MQIGHITTELQVAGVSIREAASRAVASDDSTSAESLHSLADAFDDLEATVRAEHTRLTTYLRD